MPDYFTRDVLYRNHPEYLEALKEFEGDIFDTAKHNRYLREEKKLWEERKSKKP